MRKTLFQDSLRGTRDDNSTFDTQDSRFFDLFADRCRSIAAFAQDAAVADRLSPLAAQGVVSPGPVSLATIPAWCCKACRLSLRPKKNALPIGDIKLEGVTAANGGYDIATVSTSGSNTARTASLSMSPLRHPRHGISRLRAPPARSAG